jgi:hypothetical protein
MCYSCGETCVPPQDTTLTCSPETYLRVMNPDDEMNAQTALQQGRITIDGDWEITRAKVGESF